MGWPIGAISVTVMPQSSASDKTYLRDYESDIRARSVMAAVRDATSPNIAPVSDSHSSQLRLSQFIEDQYVRYRLPFSAIPEARTDA